MQTKQTAKTKTIDFDCRYCSLVYKTNKEDPIGMASTCDHSLIMEFSQPWSSGIFPSHPILKLLTGLFQEVTYQHNIKVKQT